MIDNIIAFLLIFAFCAYIYRLFFTTTIENKHSLQSKQQKPDKNNQDAIPEQAEAIARDQSPKTDFNILAQKPAEQLQQIPANNALVLDNNSGSDNNYLAGFGYAVAKPIILYLKQFQDQIYNGRRLVTFIEINNFEPKINGNFQYIHNGKVLFELNNIKQAFQFDELESFNTNTLQFAMTLNSNCDNLVAFRSMIAVMARFQKQFAGNILTANFSNMTMEIEALIEQMIIDYQGYGN